LDLIMTLSMRSARRSLIPAEAGLNDLIKLSVRESNSELSSSLGVAGTS
jgi:hypothetical protein